MRFIVVLLALSLPTCASSPVSPGFPEGRMVASLQPVAPPAPPPAEIDESDPGALLERALAAFTADEPDEASRSFDKALGTGQLNDAGRALAYWHIFVAERQVGRVDESNEALDSFVVVAEDIIDMRQRIRFAVNNTGDFVDRFDLVKRLERARALLAASWALRAAHFGRSAEQPVPVRSVDELTFFLEITLPCPPSELDVVHHPVTDVAGVQIRQVSLSCAEEEAVDFFFDLSAVQ